MSPKPSTKFPSDLIGRRQIKSQHYAGYHLFSSLTGNILPLIVRLDKLNKPAVCQFLENVIASGAWEKRVVRWIGLKKTEHLVQLH